VWFPSSDGCRGSSCRAPRPCQCTVTPAPPTPFVALAATGLPPISFMVVGAVRASTPFYAGTAAWVGRSRSRGDGGGCDLILRRFRLRRGWRRCLGLNAVDPVEGGANIGTDGAHEGGELVTVLQSQSEPICYEKTRTRSAQLDSLAHLSPNRAQIVKLRQVYWCRLISCLMH
jgi:hypothetical protein